MSLKWSDRRLNAGLSENGVMVARSQPRDYGDNFGTSSRGINGLNRQSKINVPKANGRGVGHMCNEKLYSSNFQMSDRYDFRSCNCSMSNRMTKVRETKAANKFESAIDTSKQFYHGSKYNQVDLLYESNGRPKSKVISENYPIRDLLQSKKVWEPVESHIKYAHSRSDPDVTLRSTGLSHVEVGDSSQINGDDNDSKRGGMGEGSQNDLDTEAEGSCSSTEIASKEPRIYVKNDSPWNNSSDHSQGITSSSYISSCLSEGDNNITSSNHDSTKSSTSDSEYASQKSERDSSTYIDYGLSGCHEAELEKIHNEKGDGLERRLQSSSSLDVAGVMHCVILWWKLPKIWKMSFPPLICVLKLETCLPQFQTKTYNF